MANLQDFREKIKGLAVDDTIFTALLVLLVGVASFGLGRQSTGLNLTQTSPQNQPAATISASAVGKGEQRTTAENVTYVGSKNSDKYHLPWCSGAKRISEANKITFASAEEARAAGYKPAANCPGI